MQCQNHSHGAEKSPHTFNTRTCAILLPSQFTLTRLARARKQLCDSGRRKNTTAFVQRGRQRAMLLVMALTLTQRYEVITVSRTAVFHCLTLNSSTF